ncbi:MULTISPECIES: GntR family transcriptional regulator [unclassified Acidovorax]|uniref:GntR family transcriptional regulator n=1 Tax=unclassified Acidovorax TaxID=2684926 RepID=UPI001C473457|nr:MULTISPECIES: GntR family transcriptional regulator [unclassified Acidovorax]MBV7427367.1 GntR family transcriptional regulator [Acidovorax sp. sif0732]MBV7448491.1 GntR family transcriptional regulator [Acidovorax sp. sif0715]
MSLQVPDPAPRALTADAITTSIREMILSGKLGIGVQLKQLALAQQFGVSRIPVREALKRLEAEGLVEHTAHTGTVVAAKTTQDLLETLDIRIGLESRALKVAVGRMTKSDILAARDVLARYDASESPREWAELNIEFHMVLYRACGRPKLLKMIEDIVRSIDVHLRAHQSSTVGRKSPQTEHKDILKACAEGNSDLAVDLLEKHIEHTQRMLIEADARLA